MNIFGDYFLLKVNHQGYNHWLIYIMCDSIDSNEAFTIYTNLHTHRI